MPKGTCTVEDCSGPVLARTWCRAHYRRWQRLGDPAAGGPRRFAAHGAPRIKWKPGGPCAAQGCDRPASTRTWCRSHYKRWHASGDVQSDTQFKKKLTTTKNCITPNCGKRVKARNLCSLHYDAWLRAEIGKDPERLEAARRYQREFKAAEYHRDPERARARCKAWIQANPERAKLFDARKRRRRRGAKRIPFTSDQLAAKVAYWGYRCWMCHEPWEAIDHVKPLTKGGWDMLANCRPICRSCNSSKSNRWPFPVATR